MVAGMQSYSPADAKELVEIVRAALDARTPLQVVGAGSKHTVGYPDRQTTVVFTRAFDRIIDYDPAELVLTAGAGTPLATIDALLAAREQMLAFEPFDFASISGAPAGASTLGGVIAAGFAGSRRVSAGNVRDHLLGFAAVSARGESFVAGGRVVKNVTGYDLSKLMCGSWGQLAVLTELTLRVLPRPRVTLTLCARNLEDSRAYALIGAALRSEVAAAAAGYIPRGIIGDSHTLLRLEGFGPSVEARTRHLSDAFPDEQIERLGAAHADNLWHGLRTGAVLGDPASAGALWRINLRSTAGPGLCASLRALGAFFCADWGGSLLYARVPDRVGAEQVRTLAENAGGHATLLRASHDYRLRVCAQHPEQPGAAALTHRVKAAFDPAGLLDPQRFARPASS